MEKEITMADVPIQPDIEGEFIAKSNSEEYKLVREAKRYIFRNIINVTFGHSGIHKRKDEAIRKALCNNGTTVFRIE